MFHSVVIDVKNKLWACGLRKFSGHGIINNNKISFNNVLLFLIYYNPKGIATNRQSLIGFDDNFNIIA